MRNLLYTRENSSTLLGLCCCLSSKFLWVVCDAMRVRALVWRVWDDNGAVLGLKWKRENYFTLSVQSSFPSSLGIVFLLFAAVVVDVCRMLFNRTRSHRLPEWRVRENVNNIISRVNDSRSNKGTRRRYILNLSMELIEYGVLKLNWQTFVGWGKGKGKRDEYWAYETRLKLKMNSACVREMGKTLICIFFVLLLLRTRRLYERIVHVPCRMMAATRDGRKRGKWRFVFDLKMRHAVCRFIFQSLREREKYIGGGFRGGFFPNFPTFRATVLTFT